MMSRVRLLSALLTCGILAHARGFATDASSSPSSSSHHTIHYKVEHGDTIASVAHQFHCTTAALKELNDLHSRHLKTGQVLRIPASREDAVAASEKSTLVRHHHAASAQPVQDFDVSPSTFASCPVPASGENDNVTSETPSGPLSSPVTSVTAPPLPLAEAHPMSRLPVPTAIHSTPTPAETAASAPTEPDHQFVAATSSRPPTALNTAPAPRSSFATAIANFFGGGTHGSESGEWGNRFLVQARDLAGRGVGYDESFRPDGESHSWDMDCSNTTRYLYRVTAGISLPRTASDQYYYLHLQDKAWDAPMTSAGFADCNFLRSNLKPGDLLFWENTYRPERQPPITHVMIFLGTDSRGKWLMAGSQSGHHGLYNPARTGPDVYIFDPTHYSGGYTNWLGLVHHHGRFVAYGRPLEADASKLSVAAAN